jgi:hypothetical protein
VKTKLLKHFSLSSCLRAFVAGLLIFSASAASAATTMYMRNVIRQPGDGATQGRTLGAGRGAAAATFIKDTLAGDNAEGPYNSTTQHTNNTTADYTQIWMSNPLTSGATISGTVTFNIWANESATQANACITAELVRLNAAGVVQSIIATGVRQAELTTSSAAKNWTRTPTSTTVNAGERIGLRVYIDDGTGVTMATARTVTITVNGASAAANGDSYVTVTENLTFNDDTITATVKASGGDFTSLSAWEAGQQADLDTNKWHSQAECYAKQDTLAVTIAGWTSASHNIKIYTPTSERHTGSWDAAKYRLEVAGIGIDIQQPNVWIDGLQISVTAASASTRHGVRANTTGTTKVSNTIIKGVLSGTSNSCRGIYNYAAGSLYAWNNIIYDFINAAYTLNKGIDADVASQTSYLYNNTVYNNYVGIAQGNGTTTVKNNISYGNTDNYSGTFSGSNNLSGPAQTDAPGTSPRNGVTVTFVNEGADNFHLDTGDAGAREYGVTDPGSGLFSDDIDGQSRPIGTSWDIGADETEAATGAEVVLAGSGATATPGSLLVSVAVNATVSLTGSGATSAAGALTVSGTVSATATLSGITSTASAGDLTMGAAANGDVALAGIGLTASSGTLTILGNAAIPLPGQELTASNGALGVTGTGTIALSGQELTASRGTLEVSGNAAIPFSGSIATASLGTLAVNSAGGATVAPSGISITSAPGALFVSGNASIPLSGSGLTASRGTLGVSSALDVPLVGASVLTSTGTLTLTNTGTASLSGQVMVASTGTLSATVPDMYVPGRQKTKKIEVKGFKYLR